MQSRCCLTVCSLLCVLTCVGSWLVGWSVGRSVGWLAGWHARLASFVFVWLCVLHVLMLAWFVCGGSSSGFYPSRVLLLPSRLRGLSVRNGRSAVVSLLAALGQRRCNRGQRGRCMHLVFGVLRLTWVVANRPCKVQLLIASRAFVRSTAMNWKCTHSRVLVKGGCAGQPIFPGVLKSRAPVPWVEGAALSWGQRQHFTW